MKKFFTVLLALTMALTLGGAFAQEYYTLSEVREQATKGWHNAYADKYGREIVVDIDTPVYGEDAAPVLRVNTPEYESEVGDGWYRKDVNCPYRSITEAYQKRGGKSRYLYYLENGPMAELDRVYGAEYGNTLTLRQAYDIVIADLEQIGKSAEDYRWAQPALLSVICSLKKNTEEVIVPAFYILDVWSQMYGLPVMTHVSASFEKQGFGPWYSSELTVQVRGEREYDICDRSFVLRETIEDDIPLCSAEQVIKNLEEKIEAGHIQEVYSLRFGYAIYNDPAHPSNVRFSGLEAEGYYLVPSWVLECEFMGDAKKDYNQFEGRRSITINAQTGEMLDFFDTSAGGYGDATYKGFISWDDVKK